MTDKELETRIVAPPRYTREEADVLNKAPLATLRATAESEQASRLVAELAERYPRPQAAKGKSYARKKTQADYANAIAAFIADLLAAYETDRSEGWLRCSLKKTDYTGQPVTWHMFNGVRRAFTEAGLIEHTPGYSGMRRLGNPGPVRGKMTRFRATPSLLSACEAHDVTPATVRDHFRFQPKMPSELVQLTSPFHKTPDITKVQRLRAQVAALNSFIAPHTLTHPTKTITHLGWVRLFHRADNLQSYRWNRGGRLYSQPQNAECYQHVSETERLRMRIDDGAVSEIDISSSFLSIFYAWCDQQLSTETDAYRGILGDTDLDRKVAKFWINASFGNGRLLTKWSKKLVDDFRDRLDDDISPSAFDPKMYRMSEIKERVLQRHPLLVRLGGEIRGRIRDWSDLQFAESEIIIGTMQELLDKGVPSFPVHDSLIVPMTKTTIAVNALNQQFLSNTGRVPKLDISPDPF